MIVMYDVIVVMKVTLAEQSILVARVLSRLKMEKVRQQLRQEVDTLKTAQQRMVEEKAREGEELRHNWSSCFRSDAVTNKQYSE